MSKYIRGSHHVSIIMYHIVCPCKFRRTVISSEIEISIKQICMDMQEVYDFEFLEIGCDKDHVHFLIQSVPKLNPSQIVRTVKSIIGKQVRECHPEIKDTYWKNQFWTDGYFVSTVGRDADEQTIANYVREQGQDYDVVYRTSK